MAHGRAKRAWSRLGVTVIACGGTLTAAVVAHGCTDEVARPLQVSEPVMGAIGDPCEPTDEAFAGFSGFTVDVINFEDHFASCASGLCLVHHFQGRVDCPLGQPAPTPCHGPDDTTCPGGAACDAADEVYVPCDPDGGVGACSGGGACDPVKKTCTCTSDAQCPAGTACDPGTQRCTHFVCKNASGCQSAGAGDADNAGKACCAEGSDAPISTAVCGQCAAGSPRAAASAVYCSCRCGPAAGDPDDAGPYCACPDGFECAELRPYLPIPGVSNDLAGQYCIRAGTAYDPPPAPDQCGTVRGYFDPATCSGSAP